MLRSGYTTQNQGMVLPSIGNYIEKLELYLKFWPVKSEQNYKLSPYHIKITSHSNKSAKPFNYGLKNISFPPSF
ncbi:hypothetical protein FGF1_35940 [Flavobacteriaceae bacterium GF1]